MKKILIMLFSASLVFMPKYIQSMEKNRDIQTNLSILDHARALNEINADDNCYKALYFENHIRDRKEEYFIAIKELENSIKGLDHDLGDIEKAKNDNKRFSTLGNLCFWGGIFTLFTTRVFPIISPLTKEFLNKHQAFSLITCAAGVSFSAYGFLSIFIHNNFNRKIYHYQKTKKDLETLEKLKNYFGDE